MNASYKDPAIAYYAAANELAKHGVAITEDNSRGAQLKQRADLRRGLNAIAGTYKNGVPDDAQLDVHATIATMIDKISNQMDLDDAAKAHFGETVTNGSASPWRDTEGRALRILDKHDRLSKRETNAEHVGFGEFLRAVALGTKDSRIRNALGEGSIGTGGATVPEFLSDLLIDALRNRTACIQAGAKTVMLETQTTRVARLLSDPVAAWRNENSAVGGTAPAFDNVVFSAKSLAVAVPISRELLADAVNLDTMLLGAFAKSLAVTLDQACLSGSGVSPIPLGVLNTSGILAESGAGLGYAGILAAWTAMRSANAADPTAAIMSPATWGAIQGATDTLGQPKRPPVALESLPLLSTKSMSDSTILVGNFVDLLIGMRHDIMIEVSPQALAGNLQTLFVCHLRADVQLAHPASFVAVTA